MTNVRETSIKKKNDRTQSIPDSYRCTRSSRPPLCPSVELRGGGMRRVAGDWVTGGDILSSARIVFQAGRRLTGAAHGEQQ